MRRRYFICLTILSFSVTLLYATRPYGRVLLHNSRNAELSYMPVTDNYNIENTENPKKEASDSSDSNRAAYD